jgi:hypothetical protein
MELSFDRVNAFPEPPGDGYVAVSTANEQGQLAFGRRELGE